MLPELQLNAHDNKRQGGQLWFRHFKIQAVQHLPGKVPDLRRGETMTKPSLVTLALAKETETVLKAQDLDSIVASLQGVLRDSFQKQLRETTMDGIRHLQRTKASIPEIEDWLREHYRGRLGPRFAELVGTDVEDHAEAAYRNGGEAGAKAVPGVAFQFQDPDTKSLKVLTGEAKFWIGEHYGDHLEEKLEEGLREHFRGVEGTREDLAWALEETTAGIARRSRAYWNFFADHTTTKIREIGRVSGYEQAEVKKIRIKAQLDDRTTAICRNLHGTVISIERQRQFVDNYMAAAKSRDKDAIKEAWPWWSDQRAGHLETTQGKMDAVNQGKIGPPPYHARCRTITVAEFSQDPIDAQPPTSEEVIENARMEIVALEDERKKKAAGLYTQIMDADTKGNEQLKYIGQRQKEFRPEMTKEEIDVFRKDLRESQKKLEGFRDQKGKLNRKLERMNKSYIDKMHKAVGPSKPVFRNEFYNLITDSPSIADATNKARKFYSRVLHWKPRKNISIMHTDKRRAYYRPEEKSVNVYQDVSVRTVVHEIGHNIELHQKNGIFEKTLSFYKRRTAGEELTWLGRGYAQSEKTRFDKFLRPYMGKDYGDKATEIVSMGFDVLYTDPGNLATSDPDYFHFIVQVARGEI